MLCFILRCTQPSPWWTPEHRESTLTSHQNGRNNRYGTGRRKEGWAGGERGNGRLPPSPLLISRLIAYENGHKLDFVHLSLLVKTLGSLIPSQRVYRFRGTHWKWSTVGLVWVWNWDWDTRHLANPQPQTSPKYSSFLFLRMRLGLLDTLYTKLWSDVGGKSLGIETAWGCGFIATTISFLRLRENVRRRLRGTTTVCSQRCSASCPHRAVLNTGTHTDITGTHATVVWPSSSFMSLQLLHWDLGGGSTEKSPVNVNKITKLIQSCFFSWTWNSLNDLQRQRDLERVAAENKVWPSFSLVTRRL